MQGKFTFSSSIDEDVWHPKKTPDGYEWWYFDALSDDGTEAIVISFLDNCAFSPDYHQQRAPDSDLHTTNGHSPKLRYPSVSFSYYRNGKVVHHANNEYPSQSFQADSASPECYIGNNSFRFKTAPYGTGYFVTIDTKFGRRKRLKAKFEWLLLESDFLPAGSNEPNDGHRWNLVAPRSDVTGRITVTNKHGSEIDERSFRGTGYHDHNFDDRLMPDTVRCLQRGRVHFPDSTAVFCRYDETDTDQSMTKLFMVRDGKLFASDARSEARSFTQNRHGLRYPGRLQITDGKQTRLRVKQMNVLESTPNQLRFLSEMTLSLNDGKARKGLGISEHLSPRTRPASWIDWLTGMRIRK